MRTDEELFEALDARIDGQVAAGLAKVKQDVALLKSRGSKPPGGFGEPNIPGDLGPVREGLGAEFVREANVQAFLRNPQPGGLRLELGRAPALSTKNVI